MRATTVLFIFQGASALVLFGLFLLLFKSLVFSRPAPNATGVPVYEVLARQTKLKALRTDSGFGLVASVIYVGAFYWALPVFFWRYGMRISMWIVAGPIGAAAATSYVYNAVQESQSQPQIEGLALVAIIPIRALLGLYIGSKDQALRRRILEQRGWTYVSTCNAKSAKTALANRPPESRSAFRAWLSRKWSR